MPAVEAERVPVAGADDQLVVRHRVEVRRLRRIVPAPSSHLLRRRVEDVQDVGRLSIAQLEAEGVHQDEPVEAVAALHRDLGGEPAAEGESHQRDLRIRQTVEDVQVEMDEVGDGLEVRRAWRMAEAGVGRRDDLGAPAEEIEEACARVDVLHAVQEQHGMARAPAHHFELDPPGRQSLRGRRRHRGCHAHRA